MREPILLFEPIVNIRDVLESFLVDEILLIDWRPTLVSAATRLLELGREWSDQDLLELGHATEQLAGDRLRRDSLLARNAASNAARLLAEVRVPGIPRPEDDDWAF
ncbi:hypothetical protein [Mycobacteroides chelonae]|uniref:hypothetical protein n=1 Tax=Mycobacteroides chelonae TaxID=1774 RepID=UPI003AADE78D